MFDKIYRPGSKHSEEKERKKEGKEMVSTFAHLGGADALWTVVFILLPGHM